jgi:hypothetical protein
MAIFQRYKCTFADGYQIVVLASSEEEAKHKAEHLEGRRLAAGNLDYETWLQRKRVVGVELDRPEPPPSPEDYGSYALKRLDPDGNFAWVEWWDGRVVIHRTLEGAEKALEAHKDDVAVQLVFIFKQPSHLHVVD